MSISPENEARSNVSPVSLALPKAGVLLKARDEVEIDGTEAERNTIFDSLVNVEGEVAGLVAYSIYKQNKRAWLHDFIKASGRPPNEAESRAYIIGEIRSGAWRPIAILRRRRWRGRDRRRCRRPGGRRVRRRAARRRCSLFGRSF